MKYDVSNYYEYLYARKWDTLDEIDVFLQRYSLQRLNHEYVKGLKRAIMSEERNNQNQSSRFPLKEKPQLRTI